jgi:hypothetical protein
MDVVVDFIGKYAEHFVALTFAIALYCLAWFAVFEARRILLLRRIRGEVEFSEKAVYRRYKKIRAIRWKREQQKRRQKRAE